MSLNPTDHVIVKVPEKYTISVKFFTGKLKTNWAAKKKNATKVEASSKKWIKKLFFAKSNSYKFKRFPMLQKICSPSRFNLFQPRSLQKTRKCFLLILCSIFFNILFRNFIYGHKLKYSNPKSLKVSQNKLTADAKKLDHEKLPARFSSVHYWTMKEFPGYSIRSNSSFAEC